MKPEQGAFSPGDESAPFTMEVAVGHMTLDEAIASGLFDMPDEPGVVSIPVTMNVMIPYDLLHPPGTPPWDAPEDSAAGAPPGAGRSRRRTRFGNYPEAAAAQNIAKTFGDTHGSFQAEEAALFRTLPKVVHGVRSPCRAVPGDGPWRSRERGSNTPISPR